MTATADTLAKRAKTKTLRQSLVPSPPVSCQSNNSAHHNKNMAGLRDEDKRHFPLQNIQSCVNFFFRDQLENNEQPNLALLSIVLGTIENTLTVNRAVSQGIDEKSLQPIFPIIDWSTVEPLYQNLWHLFRDLST